MRLSFARAVRIALIVVVIAGVPARAVSAAPKNVILMIADGAGYNTWNAVSMFQGKWDAETKKSTQVYDGQGWVRYACSTHPLDTGKVPTGSDVQDAEVVYDPAKAWDGERAYRWLMSTYTDSAAAATALSTGKKTYNNAINWSNENKPIAPTLAEAAKAAGKSAGVVTTVQWSHATPAALGSARNVDRDNYAEIANLILGGETMDVILGAGNPDFDNNGEPMTGAKEYKYVGGRETWEAIEVARAKPDATYRGFRPVSTKAEFEALASGPTPRRVLGTAQVGTTLQQSRRPSKADKPADDTPPNPNVPSLVAMTKAALNVLDDDPQGLFLLVEGGAVDWANHRNDSVRMIEEHVEFLAAVRAVVDWIEANSNWNDTLLVVTADHETGLLWGPKSGTEPFDPIVDRGAGRVPEMSYNSKNHTNSLVPVFARGAASEPLARVVTGNDPVRGPYVDNTGVARVLFSALTGKPLEAQSPARNAGRGARRVTRRRSAALAPAPSG
jgi:alkaline phosphatase